MALYALWLPALALAEDPTDIPLDIQGVSAALGKQLVEYAGQPRSLSPSALRHWQQSVQQRTTQVLTALGYNSATVKSSMIAGHLSVLIKQGPVTTYSAINIEIQGGGESEQALNEFIQKAAPQLGQELIHKDYEGFKSDLLSIALTLGYFDVKYSTHRLAVSRKEHSAQLELLLDSGTRYRYGPINFKQSKLSQEFLHRWVPFKEGDLYSSSDVNTLARELRDSGYFSNVRVRADIDHATADTVPIEIENKIRKPHSATVGIGYGTDSGPRLSGNLTRHYVNRHGHRAGIDTKLSADSQSLGSYYQIPHSDPANHYLQLNAGVANAIGTLSRRYTIGMQHQRINSNRWQEGYTLNLQHETSEIDSLNTRSLLLIPGASWSRSQTRTLEHWGAFKYNIELRLNAARKALLSDISFDRAYLKLGSSHAFPNQHLIHSRMELGWLESNHFKQVPLSLRFYAGGDESIRGFGPREVSPKDNSGNAIGGRYLSTLSLEYEYRLRHNLGLAVFVDSGRAGYHRSYPTAYGGGFGLRWYSPVGPIKAYLGTPLKGDDKSVRFHLSIGN